MPRSAYPTPPSSRASASRSRQYLTKGIAREDSDDELGLEDHPWEWIYAKTNETSSSQKKRNVSPEITGARMGDFESYIGDCVLLKAEGNNEAWVGLICDFAQEDEATEDESGGGSDSEDSEDSPGKGMVANFMWFSTEREIRNEKKRRTDVLPNEL